MILEELDIHIGWLKKRVELKAIDEDYIRFIMKEYAVKYHEDKVKNLALPHVRFQLPSDKDLIDIAILFNDGKLEHDKLADMVGMCEFVVDRLYENGDVTKRCSKEGN